MNAEKEGEAIAKIEWERKADVINVVEEVISKEIVVEDPTVLLDQDLIHQEAEIHQDLIEDIREKVEKISQEGEEEVQVTQVDRCQQVVEDLVKEEEVEAKV